MRPLFRGTLPSSAALCTLLLAPALAIAGPDDEFRSGYEGCIDARNKASGSGSSSFECTICGAPVRCEGTNDGALFGIDISSCEWGAFTVGDADDSTDLEALDLGFQLYCVNRSGTLTATRSVTGRQAVTLDGAFKRAKETTKEVLRGFVPRGLAGALDLSSGETVGAAVPYGLAYGFGERGRIDVDGDVFFTRSPALQQFGLNAKGYYALHGTDPAAEGGTTFAGVTAPLQLSVTLGDAIDATPGFVLGAGGIAGYTRHALGYDWGVGIAADLVRAGGFQLPTQVVGRFGVPVSGTADFVVQPGLAVDVLAGSTLVDTVQLNALAGLQWGAWVVGGQAMYLGDGLYAMGLTVTRTDALSQSVAAGRVVTEDEARSAAKPAEVELVAALADGDRTRARRALERLRPTVEPGPVRDFLDQVTAWVDLEPGQAADQLRTMLSATATYVLIDALDGEGGTGDQGADADATAEAAVKGTERKGVGVSESAASVPAAPAADDEVDGALARLECARLVGRRESDGCATAADDANRAASERQWELAWQAWYGLQVRHGRMPPLEYQRLTQEAAAFGSEARALRNALGRAGGGETLRSEAYPRVQRHPMLGAWFPEVEQARRARWSAQVDAVSVAENWEALMRSLPGAVEGTLALDPQAPPALQRLPGWAAQARKGQITEVEADLLALVETRHSTTGLLAQRVRVLAGRDAAKQAATAAQAGRLPEAMSRLELAERLAPGDDAVSAAAVPLRAASEGERIRAVARVEGAADRASVIAALRAAAGTLRTGAPLPSDLEDARAAEALASELGGWPSEPVESAVKVAKLPEGGPRTVTAARSALYRHVVDDGRTLLQTDVAEGRIAEAEARVIALRAVFPNEPAFENAVRDARSGLSRQKVAALKAQSAAGFWASAEVERARSPALDGRERTAVLASTAALLTRGLAKLVPLVRLETREPALEWAVGRLVGDHGRWIGVAPGRRGVAPGFAPEPGLGVALRVDAVRFELAPLPPVAPEAPAVRRVRSNPERIACDAGAASQLEAARNAELAARRRVESLATCMETRGEQTCRDEVDAEKRLALTRDEAARKAAQDCEATPPVLVETPALPAATASVPTQRAGTLTFDVTVVADDPAIGLLHRKQIRVEASAPDPRASDDAVSAVLAVEALDRLRDALAPIAGWLTERLDAASRTAEKPEQAAELAARAYLVGDELGNADAATQARRLERACPTCARPAAKSVGGAAR